MKSFLGVSVSPHTEKFILHTRTGHGHSPNFCAKNNEQKSLT